MKLPYILLLGILSSTSQAGLLDFNPTPDVRVGLGSSVMYVDPSDSYSRTNENWHPAWLINADIAFNNYLGVKTTFYYLNNRYNVGGNGQELTVLTGYGLSEQGPRIYLSNGLYHEDRHDRDAVRDKSHKFNGWTSGLGIGYQWQRWSIDFNTNIRQNSDYVEYYEDKTVQLNKDEVWAVHTQAIISYEL